MLLGVSGLSLEGDSGQGGGTAPWQHHCRGGGAQLLGLTNIEVWPDYMTKAAKALMMWEDV